MGNSFVDFKENGFWSWDGYLCDLLAVLATTRVNGLEPAWLTEAREHWRGEASKGICGWISPNLSEILNSEERVQIFLGFIDAVKSRADLTSELTQSLELLGALLKGELATNESSSTDYMVSGTFPYRGVTGTYP
jgi:hypothetical protein